MCICFFFFSSRRRHTRCSRDWSSDVCSSDLLEVKDQGRGMPSEILDTSGSVAALGVGVAGMRERVRQLGGRLEIRSEEHTSELQSRLHLVCRLLLEKKKRGRRCAATARQPTD